MEDLLTTRRWARPSLLLVVVIGGVFYVLGQYIASQPQRVTQEAQAQREITVQGTGEVVAVPDVATITLGMQTGVVATPEAAVDRLGERWQAIVAAIKKNGVDEDDTKTTNLSIQPVYDYTDGRQTLRGFEASQSVEVKIRKLDTIGAVLAATSIEGVNQAGGLTFEIDDPEKLQQEAQELAINDAHAKAQALAKALDVRLGNVKNFSASTDPVLPPPYFGGAELSAADKAVKAPPVPAGTNEIKANVSITYELR